jgi:hypothetical protein
MDKLKRGYRMEKMNATRLVVICFTTVLFACCVRKGDAQDDASNPMTWSLSMARSSTVRETRGCLANRTLTHVRLSYAALPWTLRPGPKTSAA